MKERKWTQYQDQIARMVESDNFLKGVGNTSKKMNVQTVTFQVTDNCNLACTYCYQINKHTNRMSFETAKKFIDLLFEEYDRKDSYLYNSDGVVLEFIGGEPLLETDLICEIVDYFYYQAIKKKHIWAVNSIVSMISNGVLYFEDNVQNMLKKYKGKMSFSISLDGCKELHDKCRVFPDGSPSYDIAEKACKHYKSNYDKDMLTKMTIAPENVKYVYKAIVNLYENLGYEIIHCNCVYEKGWENFHAKELYNQLKKVADYILNNNLEEILYISIFEKGLFEKYGKDDDKNYCGSTGSMLAVDPFGNIFPCIRFMDTSLGSKVEPFCLGNVDDGIGRLPKHRNKINILDSITMTSQSTSKCINCPIATGCGWCTGYNYQETGTPNKRLTYICEMHKARYLANVYFWNKAYRKHNEDERLECRIPEEWALEIIDKEEFDMLKELANK